MRTDTGYLKCQAQPPFGYCSFSLLITYANADSQAQEDKCMEQNTR